MPLKIYRRKGSLVWNYRGTLAGCRQRGSTGTPDKTTAARIASKIESEFWKCRLDGPQEVLTFPKAAALYLGAGKSDRFIANLVKYWGDIKVKDMTPGAIKQAAIDMYPKASEATRNRQSIVPTQAVINHCAELELCPYLKVKKFKVQKTIRRPVMVEWLENFKANATRPDVACLAIFMFATGARISEALAIEWGDLDFKKRTALIRQGKLGGEKREAHLPMDLVLMLANLPRTAKPFNFAGHSAAKYAWKATIKRAGIEYLTFHCCRHGFATGLLRRGIDVVTVAKHGGWKSPQHVFATYGHANEDRTVTERLFDTAIDTAATHNKQKQ